MIDITVVNETKQYSVITKRYNMRGITAMITPNESIILFPIS